MPGSPRRVAADPHLIKPGDIVWLDSKHLTPSQGIGGHTWPHYAVCLYYYEPVNNTMPLTAVSGTVFAFACISSITKRRPLDLSRQVQLDHASPNHGLRTPSAVCVDFAAEVTVTVEGKQPILDGVQRLTDPVVWRVPASPTFQAIASLYAKYWTGVAAAQSQLRQK